MFRMTFILLKPLGLRNVIIDQRVNRSSRLCHHLKDHEDRTTAWGGSVCFWMSEQRIPFKLKCIALSTRILTAKVPSNSVGPSWAGQTSGVVLLQGTWVQAGDFWWPCGGESWISSFLLGSCSDSLWLLQSMESSSWVGPGCGERAERTTWTRKAAPERLEAFRPNRGYTPAREQRKTSVSKQEPKTL